MDINRCRPFVIILIASFFVGCATVDRVNSSNSENRYLKRFFSVLSQHCSSNFENAEEIRAELKLKPRFKRASRRGKELYEMQYRGVSYGVMPEEFGCTVDMYYVSNLPSKPLVKFSEIHEQLLAGGYEEGGGAVGGVGHFPEGKYMDFINRHYVREVDINAQLFIPSSSKRKTNYYMSFYVEIFRKKRPSLYPGYRIYRRQGNIKNVMTDLKRNRH